MVPVPFPFESDSVFEAESVVSDVCSLFVPDVTIAAGDGVVLACGLVEGAA